MDTEKQGIIRAATEGTDCQTEAGQYHRSVTIVHICLGTWDNAEELGIVSQHTDPFV